MRALFRATVRTPSIIVGDTNDRFLRWGWFTVDARQPCDIEVDIRHRALPFSDNFVARIYASHVLEHLNDAQLTHFLGEAYRVLRPNGVIRIVVPDLQLFVDSYLRDGLELHFDRPASTEICGVSIRDGLRSSIAAGKVDPDALLPHNGLVAVVASFTDGTPPLTVPRAEFDAHFSVSDLDTFVTWAVGLRPAGHDDDLGHRNGFTYRRLADFLRRAGFSNVCRGFYNDPFAQSDFAGLDLADKQHISLYVCGGKR